MRTCVCVCLMSSAELVVVGIHKWLIFFFRVTWCLIWLLFMLHRVTWLWLLVTVLFRLHILVLCLLWRIMEIITECDWFITHKHWTVENNCSMCCAQYAVLLYAENLKMWNMQNSKLKVVKCNICKTQNWNA